jgi:hypothetical protein
VGVHAATLGVGVTGAACGHGACGPRARWSGLGVGQLDAAAAELVEELLDALAGVFAGAAVVVGADEESLDDVVDVELDDDVPADTVDFDFERESLR